MSRAIILVCCLVSLAWCPLGALQAQTSKAASPNSDQPIEINADSLEVQEKERIAVFRGNVDAIQGDIHLRADELKVHYQGGGKSTAKASGTITRIDATGRVFVSSPSETAQGDTGVYDVDARQITLTGRVVLTRGENVIRGQRLVMNMESGKSRIEGGDGRVQGLFVPSKKVK